MTSSDRWAPAAGPALVLGYCVINSAKSVLEGALVQDLSPEFLALNAFLLAQLFYFVVCRDKRALVVAVRRNWADLLAFNVSTTVSWVAVLYAFTVFEPVVANSVIIGLIPSLTILIGKGLRPGTRALPLELFAAGCVLCAMGFLLTTSWSGSSAVGGVSTAELVFGVTACVLTAVAVVGNTFFTKRLSEGGMTVPQMMASRFVLLIVTTFVVMTVRDSAAPYTAGTLTAIAAIGCVGVIISLYLLQQGIVRTEPITVSMLFGTNLAITYVVQFFDPRLHQSATSLIGTAALCLSICLGAWARMRNRPEPGATATASAATTATTATTATNATSASTVTTASRAST
ncbi:EamA/RhaT family transporter [Streptomyces sp. NPDC006393]|uniref:EamA/RhaT family transporter n=1 Tax=Streptomyces sp. NPDC006393 TaxID=3156763 RepID=UPI0033D3FBD4